MKIAGWISLHRKVLDNPIVCKDSDHLAVWIYLLLNVTHQERDTVFKGKRITLLPGQQLFGRQAISQCLKISESKVQRILKTFEREQQIEQQTGNKNRLISILNWTMYQNPEQQLNSNLKEVASNQIENTGKSNNKMNNRINDSNAGVSIGYEDINFGSEQQIEQQLNNKRTTTEQQLNTNNNDNKKNNDNNDNNKKSIGLKKCIEDYTNNPAIIESINGFIEMRKTLRKPLTDKALILVFTKLDKLSKSDTEKIEILNQSIMNSWQGVFPLKGDYKLGKSQPNKKPDFKEREYDYDDLERKLLGWDKE